MSSDDDKTVVYPDEGEGWIVESLRWPTQKGEEGKEKETEGKRKRGRPTEDHRDMEAPSEYSDLDDEVCWVKPLLGPCYGITSFSADCASLWIGRSYGVRRAVTASS